MQQISEARRKGADGGETFADFGPALLFMAKPYDPNDVCGLLMRLTGSISPA